MAERKTWQRRAGIMLCYPFEEKRLAKWQPPYIIQPKLDGVRCRAIIDTDGNVQMVSSEMHEITSMPHILSALQNSGLKNIELDGELYVHGKTFNDIISMTSRTANIRWDYDEMEYHVFDIVSGDMQANRTLMLETEVAPLIGGESIKIVASQLTDSVDSILRHLETYSALGYEGIITRNAWASYKRARSTDIMKFKPTREDVWKIVGFQREVDKDGNPKEAMGSLLCASEGGEPFSVGSGFTRCQREEFWKHREVIVGLHVRVKYQHLTSGRGVPRFPIFLELTDGPA
jgi:ATP-dependent DNA ligase